MKKYLILLVMLFCVGLKAQAQSERRQQRIETAKIAIITNRLNLNSEQAKTFWPVYNEYVSKRKEIRKSMKQLRVENANLDAPDEELVADMRKMLAFRRSEADLDKEYFEKLLKVISPRQLATLYKTEKEFTKMLLKRLRGDNDE
ncbi:hypothetical protein SAMN05421780_101230 [Flexibacter flexilis DSM 6793]|uniref:LTXXQ motif family protein n=1 Tax=Flexibacter flexilis DSM 6793 TaxID=927664 RepID=A0A1I1DN13_9BACT|nr:hypothetical protein [Flexibacter flexilis]SFB74468.1 hypothetical protein SAMN05421780_101230 [Flexibacter flexilis DSM 6793]